VNHTAFPDGPVVLVSRPIEFALPLSYAYLAGHLRRAGQDVRILFRARSGSVDSLVADVMRLEPVLVGFGSLSPELADIGAIIRELDGAGRRFPIVVGGQMVSPVPELALTVTGADFGVLGEGELTLHDLVTSLRQHGDPSQVKGLAIRDGDTVQLTGPGEFIKDLTSLPAVPYDLFPLDEWLPIGRWYAQNCPQPHWRFRDRVINVHGGRGCPFRCNFCYHHCPPRFRPMSVAMAEAAESLQRFDGNMLYFSDETTLHSPGRVREMLDQLPIRGRSVEYSVSSRFDILKKINQQLLVEMRESGCRIMGLGIESGSDRILATIGKRFTADTIMEGLSRLHAAGILPTVSIMVGQYGETADDVEASIRLMRESVRMNPNIQYAFTVTTPFPGSELYDRIFSEGHLSTDREFYDLYFKDADEFKYVVNMSEMDDEHLMLMYQRIQSAYEEEKSRTVSRSAVRVEHGIRRLANARKRALAATIALQSRARGRRIAKVVARLDRWLDAIYVLLQSNLDRWRLRLRGIPLRGQVKGARATTRPRRAA